MNRLSINNEQYIINVYQQYNQSALKAQLNLARGRAKRHPGIYNSV